MSDDSESESDTVSYGSMPRKPDCCRTHAAKLKCISDRVMRMVFVTEVELNTCAVCGCRIENGHARVVEDLETHDGLVACKGEHERMAEQALHMHQEAEGTCSVYFTLREPAGTAAERVGYVPVRFFRRSIGAVQSAHIACPARLSYCADRTMLRVACEWGEGDSELPFKRLVSVANLRHYNPELRMHCRFPPWEGHVDVWRGRWEACERDASKPDDVAFKY